MKALPLLATALLLSNFQPAHADRAQIERGKYLATASDCAACHTATHGKPFGGGFAVSTPFGQIYGSNISSDRQYGIGSWSEDEFVAAVREGIGKGGKQLYPAMPYDSFSKIRREDVLAIRAYLLSLPAVHQPSPITQLPFPYNQRWGLRFWKWLNLDRQELQPDPTQSAGWNNGRYLVEALAHCGTCHTPRNMTKGMNNDQPLAGGDLGGWMAWNITPDHNAGIGDWSENQLVSYMKTGFVAGRASASGPMAEAIQHSLQFLPQQDLRDIAQYLRSVRPVGDSSQSRPRSEWGQRAVSVFSLRGDSDAWRKRDPGAVVFAGSCASCHGADGSGAGTGFGAYPSLFHHTTTGASDSRNLISVVLNGVHRKMAEGEILMPAFAPALSDQQISDVSNYVSRQFGNPAAATVTPQQVEALRKAASLASPPVYAQGDAPAESSSQPLEN